MVTNSYINANFDNYKCYFYFSLCMLLSAASFKSKGATTVPSLYVDLLQETTQLLQFYFHFSQIIPVFVASLLPNMAKWNNHNRY